ncbi:MAG: hypothetical protein IJ153_06125 [Clostridia bacterium]|nr:hypothetical protein [Clostridia bacterium]
MQWYQWLTVLGLPSMISGIFMLMINRNLNKRDEKRKEEENAREQARAKEEEKKRKRDETMEEQQKIMEEQNKAIMLGLQAVLRDRLLQGYRHYEEKGWADYEDRQNLENIYTQYHALGANGVMDDFKKRFDALPDYPPLARKHMPVDPQEHIS